MARDGEEVPFPILLCFCFFLCFFQCSISPGRPLIFVPPVDQFEINNGSSAVFQCEASAVPDPDVFWTFTNSNGSTKAVISTTENDTDKYQVKRVRGIGAGFGELTVLDVQYEDRGRYTCTAMNSVGTDVSNASLTVHGELHLIVFVHQL